MARTSANGATHTVLVCDDEELIRWSLAQHLQQQGYVVVQACNGKEAVEAVSRIHPAVVLLDLKMPVMDGLTALREIRASGSKVPVIVITAHGAVDSAITATQLGASAYLSKPFDLREVTLTVNKAVADAKVRSEVHYLRRRDREGYGNFIGRSSSLDSIYATLRRLENVDAPTVLVLGESGTGKDIIARSIHSHGPRRRAPFVEVDCASLPEQLIESELFGHERGAFTDARTMKRGLFEVASGGVVFLDEIGEMSPSTQVKLLRALENRTFKRVGGVASISMDVALIAATNRELRNEVEAGRFREDLFFRLNVIPIQIPALRERREDIPLLVEHFLDRFETDFHRGVTAVSGGAMNLLQSYPWPGNVRELRNVLERIVILSEEPVVQINDLPPEVRFSRSDNQERSTRGCPFVLPTNGVDLEAVERGLLAQAIERTGGNQSAAARLLGISRYALRYRIEKYEMNE